MLIFLAGSSSKLLDYCNIIFLFLFFLFGLVLNQGELHD